jgi:hypothetical protein
MDGGNIMWAAEGVMVLIIASGGIYIARTPQLIRGHGPARPAPDDGVSEPSTAGGLHADPETEAMDVPFQP